MIDSIAFSIVFDSLSGIGLTKIAMGMSLQSMKTYSILSMELVRNF